MRLTATIISSVAVLALAGDGLHAEDYLTKDGQLTRQLKVVQQQGGFAGFTGVQYTIAPNGSWISESIFNRRITPKNKGNLSAKDLAKLAAILKKYDLLNLPEKAGKHTGANPHIITLEYGNKTATLVGRVPPGLEPWQATRTVESRFAGIWQGIMGLLTPSPEGQEKEEAK
jgi:hypothetical protein